MFPYIVHPSYSREYGHNFLSVIWDRVRNELQEAKIWVFIGYSLPEADMYFQYLLRRCKNIGQNGKDIYVVGFKGDKDTDKEEYEKMKTRYKSLLNVQESKFMENGFEAFLNDKKVML
jgi:hypothetical protein